MKTLIEDLSFENEMDHAAMTQVSGGRLPQAMLELIEYVDAYTHGGCNDRCCINPAVD